jgi:ribulose-phosphate 3-epimerase
MTTISPSLLAADFLNLKSELDQFIGVDDLWLHLDIMDGHFVPNLSFGPTVLKNIERNSEHKLDAHLMVTNPEDYIKPLKDIGVHNFTFHWESIIHHDRFIHLLKENFQSVGVSLNPSTDITVIPEYLLKHLDIVLVMSVNPGFGGQSFINGCVDKIKKLEKIRFENDYKFKIQVDGGVNEDNAKKLINAGANNLVAGSYIFKSDNYKVQVEKLRN